MSRQARVVLSLLALFLLLPACGPSSSPKKRVKVPQRSEESTRRSSRLRSGSTRRVINWKRLEERIPNLDSRIDKALTLIEKAFDLKKQYDAATGAERKTLQRKISAVYAEAGDVYDEIIMEVDDIHDRESINPTKDGSLMKRGPKLSRFARQWEKRSKKIKRMGF